MTVVLCFGRRTLGFCELTEKFIFQTGYDTG